MKFNYTFEIDEEDIEAVMEKVDEKHIDATFDKAWEDVFEEYDTMDYYNEASYCYNLIKEEIEKRFAERHEEKIVSFVVNISIPCEANVPSHLTGDLLAEYLDELIDTKEYKEYMKKRKHYDSINFVTEMGKVKK